MRDTIATVSNRLNIGSAWEIHLAVMLAPIGLVTVPPETVLRSRLGKELSPAEQQMLERLPETAARLLANIPRLDGVAQIIRYQHKHFDGTGFPPDEISGQQIPLGSRLIKILIDMSQLQSRGLSRAEALAELARRNGSYDATLLAAVRACEDGRTAKSPEASQTATSLSIKDLIPGMVLVSNIETKDGLLIITAGHQLTYITLEKIRNFQRVTGVKEPILVEKPVNPKTYGLKDAH